MTKPTLPAYAAIMAGVVVGVLLLPIPHWLQVAVVVLVSAALA